MSAKDYRPVPAVLLAVVFVAAAIVLRQFLAPVIGGVRYLTFFPAVMFCALLAGRLSGIAATLMASMSVWVYFDRPGEYTPLPNKCLAVGLFIAINLLTIWMSDRVRRGSAQLVAADEAQLRLAAIVESSDDSIVSKGLDGVIQSWNAAATRLYGYEANEIVGKSIGKLVPPDLLAEQAAGVDRLRRGERIEPFETIRLHKNGTPLRVLVTMSPLRGPNGTVIGAVEIARDISTHLAAEADLRLAKQTAEQNVGQLRAVIDSMSEGVVVSDAAGNLLDWNKPALEAHGFSSIDEARFALPDAPKMFALFDGDRRVPLEDWPLSRVLRGESFTDQEFVVRRLDKPRELIINFGGRPVYDHLGRLSMAVLTLHDVTEERRAQRATRETAERLSLALSAADLGDWSWDPKTDLMTLSPMAASLYGVPVYPPPQRESMRGLLHPEDRDIARELARRAMQAGRDYEAEYRVIRPDGTMIWVSARGRGQFDADGNIVRMFGVVQDISQRKRAEEFLNQHRLQREQLLMSEQAARAEAERAGRVKDEFLATLSHELRTPLNAILGWSQILANSDSVADLRQGLEVIERNARSQAQIIEDLLDMSRIIGGKVRLTVEPLNLQALCDTAADTVLPTANARGVQFIKHCDATLPPVVGDPARIQQILWNLLTNAIKFTPKGGRVELAIAATSSGVELTVTDNGEGIEPEFLPHVFDRFRQADSSTTRRHGGLGLGLAIVKQLAELHGGQVRAESDGVGQGATFVVTLPASQVQPAGPQPSESTSPTTVESAVTIAPTDLKGLDFAVVDDEPDARSLVCRVLNDLGAGTRSFSSATEALAALTDGYRPNVIISDIGMPGEDGYWLIRQLREAGVQTPAIALTAYARPADRERAIAHGFDAHVIKPLDPAKLVYTIGQVIAGRHAAPAAHAVTNPV